MMERLPRMRIAAAAVLCGVLAAVVLHGEDAPPPDAPFSVVFLPGDKLKITEKSNFRKFEDGRFVGLSYREVQGIMKADGDASGGRTPGGSTPDARTPPLMSGRFYVFEETRHDTALIAKRIDKVVTSSFAVQADGSYRIEESNAYPALRSFPVFPAKALKTGDKWEAFGTRVVEPFRDEVFTRVQFYCGYEYLGTEMLEGRDYHVIGAQYAMRYQWGQDPFGDERIQSISGKHVVKIYYDAEGKRPAFMRDIVDEEYQLSEGGSIGFKGFILTWFDGVFPMDRSRLKEDVEKALEESDVEDVAVEEREEGLALTLNKIHFVADQAAVLPEERGRLGAIAEALKKIPDRTFLVVGHTADVGRPEEEYTLSVERAKAIVDYLVERGMEAARFVYEGRGGADPVAPNDTEENRARNRRVEIIILED